MDTRAPPPRYAGPGGGDGPADDGDGGSGGDHGEDYRGGDCTHGGDSMRSFW